MKHDAFNLTIKAELYSYYDTHLNIFLNDLIIARMLSLIS